MGNYATFMGFDPTIHQKPKSLMRLKNCPAQAQSAGVMLQRLVRPVQAI